MSTRSTTFTRAGLEFDVVDSGPIDGPVIVALHGFPQTATSLRDLTSVLNDRGYRTIAPNQRGYSPRARPPGRLAYRMPELVDDVVALIETIDRGPVHLVGHDWGAAVAWSFAATRPELVHTMVAVSVPHPGAFFRAMTSSGQLLRSYYMGLFQLPWLPERVMRTMTTRMDKSLARTGMSTDAIARVHTEVIDTGALTTALNWYRALPFTPRSMASARISVPVTHVWSTGDPFLTRRGADLSGEYVDGDYRLAVLDGSHWLPEECPGELAELIIDRVESLPR
ncbi:alpha/beta fold hydrolase [Nocardia sp. NPDC058666]|uniref:alpha/beta fold hydrolase n=1 Tax=Nocardia sp. NPDC058666 TaxID=3346587 RepID=UPI00364F7B31